MDDGWEVERLTDRATLRTVYRDKADYTKKVDERLAQLVKEGWFLPEYVGWSRRM